MEEQPLIYYVVLDQKGNVVAGEVPEYHEARVPEWGEEFEFTDDESRLFGFPQQTYRVKAVRSFRQPKLFSSVAETLSDDSTRRCIEITVKPLPS